MWSRECILSLRENKSKSLLIHLIRLDAFSGVQLAGQLSRQWLGLGLQRRRYQEQVDMILVSNVHKQTNNFHKDLGIFARAFIDFYLCWVYHFPLFMWWIQVLYFFPSFGYWTDESLQIYITTILDIDWILVKWMKCITLRNISFKLRGFCESS